MSVAVIVPLYDGGAWIDEALESVRAQELAPEAVIVVDDGSSDDGPERVRRHPGVTLLSNPGKGSSVARNEGLARVDTRYVAFLDQDDVWHPAHLRLLVETLDRHPEAGMAYAAADCFTGEAPTYQLDGGREEPFDPWTRFPFTVGVDGPSLALLRTRVLRDAGEWEECGTGMGDALLFLKLGALHPLVHRHDRTVGKRIHASQQWLQVRELGVPYLGYRREVMARALDFRRERAPGDPALPRLERRLEALGVLRDLTGAIEGARRAEIPPLAERLERLLRDEPREHLPHVFYCLMGALFKTYDAEELREARDRVFTELLEDWPADAARTAGAIRGMIGERPHVS